MSVPVLSLLILKQAPTISNMQRGRSDVIIIDIKYKLNVNRMQLIPKLVHYLQFMDLQWSFFYFLTRLNKMHIWDLKSEHLKLSFWLILDQFFCLILSSKMTQLLIFHPLACMYALKKAPRRFCGLSYSQMKPQQQCWFFLFWHRSHNDI